MSDTIILIPKSEAAKSVLGEVEFTQDQWAVLQTMPDNGGWEPKTQNADNGTNKRRAKKSQE